MNGYSFELDKRIAELEADLKTEMGRANSWQEHCYKLEAECAALRAALSSAAYYYEPATMALAQSDAGAALLKRLQAAEAVCEYIDSCDPCDCETTDQICMTCSLIEAWRKEAGK